MQGKSNRVSNGRSPCETGRMKVVAVIPARLASTRLPRKMLRKIAGTPLLAWVYRGVRRCSSLDHVIVATDSEEIMRFCEQQDFAVRMTSAAHRSGTERVHEISTTVLADVYLNVQGDEPLTRPEHIESLIAVMQGAKVEVGTLKTRATTIDIDSPGAVKVVTDAAGRALYFSRATIPHDPAEIDDRPHIHHPVICANYERAFASQRQGADRRHELSGNCVGALHGVLRLRARHSVIMRHAIRDGEVESD